MRKMIRLLCMLCATLLLAFIAGCSSSGYSGAAAYGSRYDPLYNRGYYGTSWDYDNYYRDGVDRNRNQAAAAAAIRSERGTGRIGGGSFGGGGFGGGRGGGGRR